jgi:molecular chaperone DnaK (HSP70)
MALIPQPIFYRKLKRADGGKKRSIFVTNTDDKDFKAKITDIVKPEWLELEGLYSGQSVAFKGGNRKTPVVVQINTDHKFFPTEKSYDQPLRIDFDNGESLPVTVTIQEIEEALQVYRGTFAVDFGTTNTVYSYKTSLEDALDKTSDAFKRASCSEEIPSFVFFKDVSDNINPKYSIGNEAKFDIKDHSSQTYSYFMSVKRQLGHDQKYIVMDEFGGLRREHKQDWTAEDIAAFFIRAILERAQKDMQARIPSVVATFPTLFSEDQKKALSSAYQKAFQMMNIPFNEDSLFLDLNETNAATFSYIYGTMMEEFRRFQAVEKRALLLAYDFGGGTIDISLIDASIKRDVGSITISTDLKGLTGELYYGGDNVTLEVYRILKKRIALMAAEKRASRYEKEKKPEKKKGAAPEDIWAGGGASESGGGDVWGSVDSSFDPFAEQKAVEKPIEAGPSIMDDPEVEHIENHETEEAYKKAVQTVMAEKPVVEQAIAKAKSIYDTVLAIEKTDGSFVGGDQTKKRAEIIEKALETVYPTKFSNYEDDNPDLAEASRQLFHELWHEADLLKVRMVNSEHKIGRIQSTLKKVAKYTSVEPINYNEINITLDELNAHIKDDVVRSIGKAHELYKRSLEEVSGGSGGSRGGLVMTSESKAPELKVLLFGNSSYLPIVREKVLEIFGIDEAQIVMDKAILKRAVAIGACEEHTLRSAFGKGGFITYNFSDFLDKLPYSVGISHESLALLGMEDGWCPIFARGMKGGETRSINSKTYRLLHKNMKELPMYANYHDGSKASYLGWFDWTKPAGDVPVETLWTPELIAQETGGAAQAAPCAAAKEADPFSDEAAKNDAPAGAPAANLPIPKDNVYRVKMELLPSRKIRAYDMQTGKYYDMIPRKEKWEPDKNPFGGTH